MGDTTQTKSAVEEQKEKQEHVLYDFACSSCNLSETADYKGTSPPFSRNIDLKYPSYVMKDPFSPPGKGEMLVLGADCMRCNKPVCISKDCSIFYLKMYCLDCAQNSLDEFPVEMKSKIAQIKRK